MNFVAKLLSVKKLEFIPYCLTIFILSACATMDSKPEEQNILVDGEFYAQEFPEVSINTLALNATQDEFRVGDNADIFFFNVNELSNIYPVDREGNINFPLIGQQKVSGLTTLELQNKLVEEYGNNYLQDPSIIVKRQAAPLGKFVIDGSVSKPGVFELTKPIRLSEAVAMAGGLMEKANQKEIFMVREIEGKKKVKTVNLKKIRLMGASDPVVHPNDIVFVQDSTGKVAYNELLRSLPLLSTILFLGAR